jgi:hypothetical protein
MARLIHEAGMGVTMSTRWARLVRGGLAAVIATFVAAFSHSVAGGEIPSWFSLGVSFALSLVVCVMLTARRLSLVRLAIAVSASQALFHTLFSAVGDAAPMATSMSGMHHGAAVVMSGPLGHHDGWMWTAHACAAVITILALRFGESALWGLLETARLFLARLLALASAVFADLPAVRSADRFFLPRALALLLSAMRHRGPPRFIAFA